MVHLLSIVQPMQHQNDQLGLLSGVYNFEYEHKELKDWVRRWRWATRISANGAGGSKGLTNLAFIKVEALMGNVSK